MLLNLSTLHLEELVVFPEKYKELIADPEASYKSEELYEHLCEQGFVYGSGDWRNPPTPYLCLNLDDELGFGPFNVRVSERMTENDFKYHTEEGVLIYRLEFDVFDSLFAPILGFIKQWGATEHETKGKSKLNHYLGAWLIANDNLPPQIDDKVYVGMPSNKNYVRFEVQGEEEFFELLKNVSTCFRTLATQHVSDPIHFDYVDAELKDRDYYDLTNTVLVPMIRRGLLEGLAAFRQRELDSKTKKNTIALEINKKRKVMLFYAKGETTPFYEFEIGKVLSVSLSLLWKQKGTLVYSQQLSHWFQDAMDVVREDKLYQGLKISSPTWT